MTTSNAAEGAATEPETTQWRPALHFTPRDTWMNDPNGLILHKGVHHLFFQNNPHDRVWGNMSWGHATSTDLLHWDEQPVALTGTPTEGIFSGSAVWDRENTSGLGTDADGNGPLVALYTSAFTGDETFGDEQAQSLAWSTDDGQTWTKHPANPILRRGSKDFRDPKVFWHEPTGRWVMVCVEALDRQAVVYTSANLVNWEYASTFGPAGAPLGIWECPDLVRVPIEGPDGTASGEFGWVFIVSLGSDAPAGGSGMQWIKVDFDGVTITADDANRVRWFDLGPDCYAAVSFSGTGDVCRMIGWFSNWEYAMASPTRPWASAMTVARELTLVREGDDWKLRQTPVLPDARPDSGTDADAGATLVTTTLAEGDLLTLSRGDDCSCRTMLRISRTSDGLLVDRTDASTTEVHAKRPSFTVPLPSGPVELVALEDHGLVELYLDGGLTTATVQTFPATGPLRVGATTPVEVTAL